MHRVILNIQNWHQYQPKMSPSIDINFLHFTRAFTKFSKATISLVMSVCPTTWNNSATTVRIFKKFDITGLFFENL
jgi:hypothetical protein